MELAFKSTVRLDCFSLSPETLRIWSALLQTAPPLEDDTVVITSANDSHSSGLHPLSMAYDVRTHPPGAGGHREGMILATSSMDRDSLAVGWVRKLRMVLGFGYDVIYEADNEHIHVERDARKGG